MKNSAVSSSVVGIQVVVTCVRAPVREVEGLWLRLSMRRHIIMDDNLGGRSWRGEDAMRWSARLTSLHSTHGRVDSVETNLVNECKARMDVDEDAWANKVIRSVPVQSRGGEFVRPSQFESSLCF